MSRIVALVLLFQFYLSHAQHPDSLIVWSGIMIPSGKSYADAQVVWLKIPAEITNKKVTENCLSRQESYQTEFYALHKVSAQLDGQEWLIEESKAHKKKLNRGVAFCRQSYRVKYNDKTGYLEGTYFSIDCRGVSGKVVLFKTDKPLSEEHEMSVTHAWVRKLIDDLKAGKVSPTKMAEMRNNFEFKPLYFDYDKDLIRDEYKIYLKEMAVIVKSHSDLRIKVTGHTDADGSDAYNLELSKRRAQAIVNFFVQEGLSADRIEIDFKGKREPVAPNSTPEGKQRNRRVDFSFI